MLVVVNQEARCEYQICTQFGIPDSWAKFNHALLLRHFDEEDHAVHPGSASDGQNIFPSIFQTVSEIISTFFPFVLKESYQGYRKRVTASVNATGLLQFGSLILDAHKLSFF